MRTTVAIVALGACLAIVLGSGVHAQDRAFDVAIREVQRKLAQLGYTPGAPDGKWGRRTMMAVREFQEDNRLSVTGELNDETKAAILKKNLQTISGVVANLNSDGQTFTVKASTTGSSKILLYTERTSFTAGTSKVPSALLKDGLAVEVTFVETYGAEGPNPGWVAIINRAVSVTLPDSLKDSPTLPSQRFVDNRNGTITDTATGLMWQKGHAKEKLTHQGALDYATNLTLGGHDDWRLPSSGEFNDAVLIQLGPKPGSARSDDDVYWTQEGLGRIFLYDPSVTRGPVVFGSKDVLLRVRCVRGHAAEEDPPK